MIKSETLAIRAAGRDREYVRSGQGHSAWEEVKHSNRVSNFQRYLKEFHSGMFVRLADSQMPSLIER